MIIILVIMVTVPPPGHCSCHRMFVATKPLLQPGVCTPDLKHIISHSSQVIIIILTLVVVGGGVILPADALSYSLLD